MVVVHDPQPLALLELHGANRSRWIWRCHVDTSEPNPSVWGFLRPFVVRYDAAVFTLGGFVPPDFPLTRTEIIPPAIDPESPKNLPLGDGLAARVLEWIGVDTAATADRPDLAVRRMEGSTGRGHGLPAGPRAGSRSPARAGRFHGPRRPRGLRTSTARSSARSRATLTSTCSRTSPASGTSRSMPSNDLPTSSSRSRSGRDSAWWCRRRCGRERRSWPDVRAASRCNSTTERAATSSILSRNPRLGSSTCSAIPNFGGNSAAGPGSCPRALPAAPAHRR